jgi:uncharacterized membrane protein YGL010W
MSVMGRASWDEWISEYALSHQNPINRLTHSIGIPMIAASVILALPSLFVPGLWPVPASLFVVGWVLQFIGHYFEGKPPEFLRDYRFLFVGLRWWFAKMSGRA